MSIELQLKNIDFDQSTENPIKLQYIPASIDENAPANVDEFFNNYTQEVNGVMKNALRGYPLDGCQMNVPDNFQGIVFQETQRPLGEDANRVFKANGIFSEFIYWNYDREPSNNDPLKQALIWNDFADVLHVPISLQEFDSQTSDSK